MLGIVDQELIGRLYHRQGWSVRRIARELGHDRATIQKYLAAGSAPPRYQLRQPRAQPVVGPVLPLLRQWLAEDEQLSLRRFRGHPDTGDDDSRKGVYDGEDAPALPAGLSGRGGGTRADER